MQYYDYVFVGASPLSIFEACHRVMDGARVLVVERHVDVGGAWRVERSEIFEAMDEAPHIVQPFPGVYDFLENAMGIPMTDVTDQSHTIMPYPFFGQWKYPYIYWDLTDQSSFSDVLSLQMKMQRDGISNSAQLGARMLDHEGVRSPIVRYFKEGAFGLEKMLKRLIDVVGLDVRFETEITAIQEEGQKVRVTLGVQDVRCRKLWFGTNSAFQKFRFPKVEIDSILSYQRTTSTTIFIRDAAHINFKVANFIDHKFLRFAVDATGFARFRSPETYAEQGVLKVYCRPGVPFAETMASATIYELILLGLIAPEAKISLVVPRTIDRPKIPGRVLNMISSAYPEKLVASVTNNFSKVIWERRVDWQHTIGKVLIS